MSLDDDEQATLWLENNSLSLRIFILALITVEGGAGPSLPGKIAPVMYIPQLYIMNRPP